MLTTKIIHFKLTCFLYLLTEYLNSNSLSALSAVADVDDAVALRLEQGPELLRRGGAGEAAREPHHSERLIDLVSRDPGRCVVRSLGAVRLRRGVETLCSVHKDV